MVVRSAVLPVDRGRADVRDLAAVEAAVEGSRADDTLDDSRDDSRPTNKDSRNIDNHRTRWCALPSSCPIPSNHSRKSCC